MKPVKTCVCLLVCLCICIWVYPCVLCLLCSTMSNLWHRCCQHNGRTLTIVSHLERTVGMIQRKRGRWRQALIWFTIWTLRNNWITVFHHSVLHEGKRTARWFYIVRGIRGKNTMKTKEQKPNTQKSHLILN